MYTRWKHEQTAIKNEYIYVLSFTNLKTEEIKVVYLKADLKTLELRNRTRSIEDQARASLKEELDFFSKLKIDSNFILDTSKLSLSQTAKAIISEKRFIIK